jgi:hydroxylamine reductase (hybrid-cluster protein)
LCVEDEEQSEIAQDKLERALELLQHRQKKSEEIQVGYDEEEIDINLLDKLK